MYLANHVLKSSVSSASVAETARHVCCIHRSNGIWGSVCSAFRYLMQNSFWVEVFFFSWHTDIAISTTPKKVTAASSWHSSEKQKYHCDYRNQAIRIPSLCTVASWYMWTTLHVCVHARAHTHVWGGLKSHALTCCGKSHVTGNCQLNFVLDIQIQLTYTHETKPYTYISKAI